MPIRPATLRDLDSIASICAAAFHDEEFVGPIMHPHRDQFPADYLRYWQNRTREHYWDFSRRFLVSYCIERDSNGNEREVVTGMADWVRQGKGWEKLWGLWGKWDPRNLFSHAITWYHYLVSFLRPNRAAHPTDINLYPRLYPFIGPYWTGPRAICWNLDTLAVHPSYQKHGFGRELVAWGLQQADREGIAATVLSADKRENFYMRCGFEEELGRAWHGEGNPLKGRIRGGAIIWRKARERQVEEV